MAARARQLCFPCGCIGDTQYFDRGVVSVLQQPPSVMKRRQLLPASPYGARAGDAVTLASRLQTTLHCLRRTMWRKKRSFSLIHYLAPYLWGLSGQREVVSCRGVGGKVLGCWSVDMCLKLTSVKNVDILD